MSDAINKFITELQSEGIQPSDASVIVADDVRRRYHVEGDKRGSLNGEYVLREDADGFAVGFARSYKTGATVSWHVRSPRKATDEQKQEWADKREAERKRREEEDKKRREAGRAESVRIWGEAEESESHPYSTRKGVSLDGVKTWLDVDRFETCITVPLMRGGEIVGMQKIYPDGDKMFVPGSDIKGASWDIGDVSKGGTVALVEGWATGQTVNAATGWPVVVAFNAGNLKPVAQALVKRTSGMVVICNDEDLWTFDHKHRSHRPDVLPERDAPEWVEWREAGYLVNRGREDAMQAAASIGGAPCIGPVEGGDWNDVAVAMGIDEVGKRLLGSVSVVEPVDNWEPDSYEDEVGPSYDDTLTPDGMLKELVNPLGYDKDVYYFLPRTKGQIIELSATALGSVNNLYQLASVADYQLILGGDVKAGELTSLVTPKLIDMCHKRGIYEPEKVFGAGAWRLGKRVYVNTGRAVYDCKSGVEIPHMDINVDGVFVKEARAYDLDCEPLKNAEANKLYKICQSLTWKRPISGTLLSGWLVIAAVGGALRWRPHVFITGPKGAGKSTVVEMIVEPMLADAELRQDGGSTEAGLRKSIGDSSRPVVMDEFEGENKRDAENVQKILFWARKAASGGVIVNANGSYRAQSCVCFAAINPLVAQGADADRVTLLELQVNSGSKAEAHYEALLDAIHETITPEYAKRMIKRTVDNVETLLHNVDVFTKYAARILGSKRAGDQIGPMLAGAYMLHTVAKVTDQKAEEWCSLQDWSWIHEQQDGTDSERLVRRILNSMIEYSLLDKTVRMPVSEMITRVVRGNDDADACAKSLARVGMVVKDGWLCVANSDDGLSGLLKDTPWTVYRSSLARYDGATADGKTMRFGAGSPRRYLKIPLAGLLDDVIEVRDHDDTPF